MRQMQELKRFHCLGEINFLEYDQEVGYIIFGVGILVFLIALLLPLIIRD
jgi:hypothetical protein